MKVCNMKEGAKQKVAFEYYYSLGKKQLIKTIKNGRKQKEETKNADNPNKCFVTWCQINFRE